MKSEETSTGVCLRDMCHLTPNRASAPPNLASHVPVALGALFGGLPSSCLIYFLHVANRHNIKFTILARFPGLPHTSPPVPVALTPCVPKCAGRTRKPASRGSCCRVSPRLRQSLALVSISFLPCFPHFQKWWSIYKNSLAHWLIQPRLSPKKALRVFSSSGRETRMGLVSTDTASRGPWRRGAGR